MHRSWQSLQEATQLRSWGSAPVAVPDRRASEPRPVPHLKPIPAEKPRFGAVFGFEKTCRNLSEIALRSREIRGSVCWAVRDTATFQTTGESSMPPNLATEIAALPRLRVSELRAKFAAIFGEPTPSHNKVWLVKRLAWRLQAQAEGDLSERARKRAAELVADADLRLSAPPTDATTITREQPTTL